MNKKYTIITLIILIALAATSYLIANTNFNEKKLDLQEQEIEAEVEKINADNPLPENLDQVYSGPNEDRPLPESFY